MRSSTVDIDGGAFEVHNSMQSGPKFCLLSRLTYNEIEFPQAYLEVHNSDKQFQQYLQMSAVWSTATPHLRNNFVPLTDKLETDKEASLSPCKILVDRVSPLSLLSTFQEWKVIFKCIISILLVCFFLQLSTQGYAQFLRKINVPELQTDLQGL